MKPANEFGLSLVVGSAVAWVGLLAKPIGLPRGSSLFFEGAGILIFAAASLRLKRAKARGPDAHGTMAPDAAVRARIRYYWFVAVGLVLGCVLIIPVLPYTVDNYSPALLYAVIPAQVIVVAGFLIYLRRKLLGSRPAAR